MTTCRNIIRSAMLEIKALASGEEPTADELSDGLERLQGIVNGLLGNGVGTSLADVDVAADSTLLPDTRAIVAQSAAITLTFPATPANGQRVQIIGDFATHNATLDGNGRTIPAVTLSSDATNNTYIYIADTASWALISPLTADSDLPINDDEFFTLELGKRLVPMFGGQMTPEGAAALQRASNRIRARFRSQAVTPCDDAVQFLSRQSYCTGYLGPGGGL